MDRQPVLTFEEETHTYRVNGKVVPSVTQVLVPLIGYDGVSAAVLERKSVLGKAVHKATELWEADDLDEGSLDPAIRPYFDAYLRFVDKVKPKWNRTEHQVYHPRFEYAGTLDREGLIFDAPAVVDLKCTVDISPAVGVQAAAYAEAIGDGIPRARFALQLRPDGTYRFPQFTDHGDFQAFLACLAVHRFKERHQCK